MLSEAGERPKARRTGTDNRERVTKCDDQNFGDGTEISGRIWISMRKQPIQEEDRGEKPFEDNRERMLADLWDIDRPDENDQRTRDR
jgi:hypothetical protein